MSIKTRLSRLEKATVGTGAAHEVYEARAAQEHAEREAAWAIMQQTMSEEHVRLVVEAYAAGAQYVQSSEYNTPAGRLLRRCLDAISRLTYRHWPQTEIADEVVLAMPPEVAEVYLAEDALPLHDCEDCGFRVPVTPGEYKGKPARRHFDACPLCSGRVGWSAFFSRRRAEAMTGSGDTIR
jgi:hypothetical protein